ncbi:MAG: S41 family peptidase [Gemmatimonadota bacterium]|nr:S41 family peptidase [Gemmatimonadota bacterium]
MPRRTTLALCFAAAVGSASLSAQTPTAPAIPDTPAGRVLRAWLDAFNSADSARVDAYARQFEPDLAVPVALMIRDQSGGFDLLTIERSEPRHVEFTLKERNGPRTAYGMLEVSAAQPFRVTARHVQPLGPNVSVAALRIDAATRARVIDSAIARLDEHYVFPDVAKRMADSLRARLARGAYDAYGNGMSFAMKLNDELRELGRDKHLRVNYSVRPLPPEPASRRDPSPEDRERYRQRMEEINCGFVKAERLEGNVGYLKFNMFADPEVCGPTAAAAMNFLAGTRALIIDLRDNGGGSPHMVAYVSSYLFSQRTHLNDLWTRKTGATEEFWTRDTVPGRRFGGEKPVYVLTSARTFSGAEEFAYNLKTLKRATIVGETTGGGAHPVSGHRIDEHFMIGVPFARAVNPVTRTNWEGVGGEPDVKVPASEALATAQKLLREKTRP